MSARTSKPSIAELRAATQPPSIFERNSGEHWAGKLYVRRLSPYLTRAVLPTRLTPNGMTWIMLAVGVAAAAVLTLPGLLAALAAFLLIQLQILLDCSDGEVARWRGHSSPRGIYLDRIGHYLTEAAIPIAIGLRADEWSAARPGDVGGYTVLGLVVAVLVLVNKAFTDLVIVARAKTGRPLLDDVAQTATSKVSGIAAVRRAAGHLPFFRAFVAVEASLLALAAAVVDVVRGDVLGTQVLIVVMVPLAVVTAAGHLLGVLTSSRLD